MSTYSPSLRIELITTGDQAGTWGATTNTNLGTLIESAIAGYVSVSVISANQALTALNGAADEARQQMIALTTTTGANFAVYAPPAEKTYIIYNASAYTATIYNSTVTGNTTAAGTGVAIPAGKAGTVWTEGTNFRLQNTYLDTPTIASPTLTGTPVAPTASPGTSTTQVATTAFVAAATSGLGTMATQNANNVAITGGSITGITDLAVADGGTGASTAAGARTSLGTDDAANLTTGLVATARLASGTANSSSYLRGDQTWATLGASGGGFLAVFTSSSTWTAPTGVTQVRATVIGGGGAGGGVASNGGADGVGGGGGAGGVGAASVTVVPGTTYTVTVGAGGTGVSGGNGGSGGTSSIGSLVSATGGSGAIGNVSSGTAAGGAGGTSAATISITGATGSNGVIVGGCCGSTQAGAGAALPTVLYFTGFAGAAGTTGSSGQSAAGGAATGYGAGGGGAMRRAGASQPARAGGNGAGGVVYLEW